MDKEKKRKFHLVLYGIAIPVSLFALYTFIFVFDNGIGWKIALIIIGGRKIFCVYGEKSSLIRTRYV